MSEYSSQDVALYLNAINRTMARKGVTKVITDDFWKDEIVPILYPLWDSDKDKLESFIRYETGLTLMNKNKFQRNQRTGEYKWVSYEMNLSAFEQSEIDDLYNKLTNFKWEEHLTENETFSFSSIVHSSNFRHSQYVALKAKDALVDRFKKRTGKRPNVERKNPDHHFIVRISEKDGSILWNSSGDPLFKRGYRTHTVEAPVN